MLKHTICTAKSVDFLFNINQMVHIYQDSCTLGKFNFRTPRFLKVIFFEFFTIFSKTVWNSEMCFTSLESPDIQLFWASTSRGMAIIQSCHAQLNETCTFFIQIGTVVFRAEIFLKSMQISITIFQGFLLRYIKSL